ncbi:phosphoribosylanthranilate isomerase [Terriglobus tenax]|uniref:phosphoribosylanthranilate isomerase n=1 Tax=Terriglobus tenax TaxID=1111115 RepID=UPI0021E0E14F|nr:phosphoribosylanthranilate isomerase [Terriglobus tenax]
MWVKICANTNLEDARLAAALGADALGFVFAAVSTRRVTPEQVAPIVRELPEAVEKIGVFAELEFASIRAAVEFSGLTGVQLHGSYDPELIKALRREFDGRIDILQTLHWQVTAGLEQAEAFEANARRVAEDGLVTRLLVDAKTPKGDGGTGTVFDWTMAKPSFEVARRAMPVVLAGGLTPDNVAEAIRTLHPWGVDIASGVECAPGKKDPAKLKAFVTAAKAG